MREPAPDHSTSHYERPHHAWICGLVHAGESCPAGPTARGRCPAMAECAPVRNGDRWECNRSQLRGGPCECGPTPDGGCGRVLKCRPMRSLRSIRGRFVAACALLVIGVATITLSAAWRDRVIAPGPLARQHAQLMERTDANNACAACHAAADQNAAGWMSSLVVGHGESATQSQLCVKCHGKTASPELALAAHSLPPEILRQISAKEPTSATSNEQRSIACAACHREHHGAQANLTAIDNVACQTCHGRKFESFATDHPDFGSWPYERRSRIAFNHAAHRDKHFADKKQAFDCRSCHLDDSTGRVQQLASYEAACASCHDEKIATSVAQGVPMFTLPTLDTAALKSAGFDIGTWPKGATGDFDGRLPPAMKLLLAADPAAAQAMAKLGADFDFQDVDPNDRQHLEACAALATAIKKLMPDLAGSTDGTLAARLHGATGHAMSPADISALVSGLSADTLRGAAVAWKGEAPAEPRPYAKAAQRELRPPANGRENDAKRPLAFSPAGAWFRDDASFSIRYRPSGHADPVLTAWLNTLAVTPNLDQHPVAAAMFKELSKVNAAGLCASCHSAEKSSAGQLTVNWRAYDRTTEPRGFTKFAHGPHLLLPQLADCTHCHSIDSAASATVAYTDLDATRFVSDFAPMTKRHCAECHTPKAAGDDCQKCHSYHVERSPFALRDVIPSRTAR